MNKERPIILITNDDGITAPGIRALVNAVQDLGDIVVVAPDSPQSGMGHAITIGKPLRLHPVNVIEGVQCWQTSGTPVDCVKLARDKVLHRKPTICLSGINHGANHSINVIYSGTMSAAMEAAIEGIPSVGFSLLDYNFDADFTIASKVVRAVTKRMLEHSLQEHTLLNVNIPKVDEKDFKGIKFCRQAHAKWAEDFDERIDPRGEKYFWMVGKFINLDRGSDTDVEALKNGFASIVPIRFDLTDIQTKNKLEKEWNGIL
ncbi:MAG: 5'/3'-nucleotidase SurE [Bacteroidetes bacterium]|nr:5'/3'-nucleotidase SurE [Bacteroidota bacterium]MBS1739762.1 5'/3'-nucleotidase SurE [Bacteroidota bacterium]MBS1776719.1 5'/3'-nucleotidase SurE [Bacteroidota bacterium]